MGTGDVDGGAALAAWAALLADRTRAQFCLAMLDGRAWTAGELARRAGVAASTASEHLDRLVAGGLVAGERQGRHRYVRLADADVAALVEAMTAAATHGPPPAVRSLSGAARRDALARARTCYDHLAGRLGVAVTDAMTRAHLLAWERGLTLTPEGTAWLSTVGIAAPDATARRPAVRSCLDWTERRPHLAGAVGAALCGHAFTAGWIRRVGTGRAVALTPTGRDALSRHLGIDGDALAG